MEDRGYYTAEEWQEIEAQEEEIQAAMEETIAVYCKILSDEQARNMLIADALELCETSLYEKMKEEVQKRISWKYQDAAMAVYDGLVEAVAAVFSEAIKDKTLKNATERAAKESWQYFFYKD